MLLILCNFYYIIYICALQTFPESEIRDIACGGSHSAAIGNTGIIYTWGHGLYGRLGHGNNLTQLKPKPVSILYIFTPRQEGYCNHNIVKLIYTLFYHESSAPLSRSVCISSIK